MEVNVDSLNFSQFDALFSNMNSENHVKQSPLRDGDVATKTSVTTVKEDDEQVVIKDTNTKKNNAASAQSLVMSGVYKLNNIAIEMNNMFVERADLIKIMQLALITHTNVLMLGRPGTAKSMLTYEMCERIDGGNYFQWMLNKTSDPSEILGSFSVKQMENDRFMRITKGKLPEAHIAFLDEVYKSNAPTLNALLTIMNEHIFYNDGKPIPVPLITMFGASNEPPEDDSLLALHDRFIFRIDLEYIHDAAGRKKMHNFYIDKRRGVLGLAGKTMITLDELEALYQESLKVNISKDILNTFVRFAESLEKNYAIQVSDRRLNECIKILQGSAVLAGRNKVVLEDFRSLKYVLWEKREQLVDIEKEIEHVCNPYDEQFASLKKSFEEIKNKIDNVSTDSEKAKLAIQSKNAINRIVSRLNKLCAEASTNGKDTTNFEEYRNKVAKFNEDNISKSISSFESSFGVSKKSAPVTAGDDVDDPVALETV